MKKIGLRKHSKVRLNFNLMEPSDGKPSEQSEPLTAKAEDVYEFKSSSKEPTPDPSVTQEKKEEARKDPEGPAEKKAG